MTGGAQKFGPPCRKPSAVENSPICSSADDPPRCRRCNKSFEDQRKHARAHTRSMPSKRFCSEHCRKAAESQRRRDRRGQ